MKWEMTVVGMHQDCNGQKGESTAMNRTVKDNK